MSKHRVVYCEICGREIPETSAFKIYVENTEMIVCPTCYFKYISGSTKDENRNKPMTLASTTFNKTRESSHTRFEPGKSSVVNVSSRTSHAPKGVSLKIVERYEIVSNYHEVIKKAREQKGLSTKDLAIKLGESENVVKRIESGRLIPSIELAKRIENVLGVKIIVVRVEEEKEIESRESRTESSRELTLGDVVAIKKKN